MKKLIIIPVIALASLLNAQNNEIPAQDSLKDLVGQILLARTPVHSYDGKFSVQLGGKGLAHYITASDSTALFNILGKKGFGGVSIRSNQNSVREYWYSDLDGDSAYSVLDNGKWIQFSNKEALVKIMKQDLQKEFKLAEGSNFEVIDIRSEKSGNDFQIEESYEYYDVDGQKVRLDASFLNGQLRAISFSK